MTTMNTESETAQKCSKGNTKSFEPKTKVRNFCFTYFSDDANALILNDDIRYLAYGVELCPTTGKQHYQSFMTMKNQYTFSSMKKYLKKWLGVDCHFEMMAGSLSENEDYCSKDGQFTELGAKAKQGQRTDLIDLKTDIFSGNVTVDNIACDNPNIYHQYGRTLSKIEDIYLRSKFRTEMTIGIWYYGDTGVGKSHKAFEGFTPSTHYVFPNDNGWWDGYTQQETIIINDFRGDMPYNELLQLVDKWPHTVRRRCREPMPFTSKFVIITSSLPPEEIYKNRNEKDKIEQLLRRFTVTKLDAQPPPKGNPTGDAARGLPDNSILVRKVLKRKVFTNV